MGSSIYSVKTNKVEHNVYCMLPFYKRKGNVYMLKKGRRKETERINQKAEEEGNGKKEMSGSQCNIIVKICPPQPAIIIHYRTCAIQSIFVKFAYVYTKRPESVLSSVRQRWSQCLPRRKDTQ